MIDILGGAYFGVASAAALVAALRLQDGRTARERIAPAWIARDDWAVVLAGLLWPMWTIYVARERLRRDRRRKELG